MPSRLLDPTLAEAAPTVDIGAPLTEVGETLSTLRLALFNECGKRTNLPNEEGGTLDDAINWAHRQMVGALKIKECYASFAIQLVLAQPFYALPIQCASIRTVTLIDTSFPSGGRKLIPVDSSQYAMLPDRENDPTNYFRYGRGGQSMLVVYGDPIDDQVLSIDCRIRPDDFGSDTDSPIIPVEFHEALKLLAKHKAFRSVNDRQKSAEAMNDYKETLGDLLSTDADEDGELPSGVQFVKDPRDLSRIRTTSTRWDDERG